MTEGPVHTDTNHHDQGSVTFEGEVLIRRQLLWILLDHNSKSVTQLFVVYESIKRYIPHWSTYVKEKIRNISLRIKYPVFQIFRYIDMV